MATFMSPQTQHFQELVVIKSAQYYNYTLCSNPAGYYSNHNLHRQSHSLPANILTTTWSSKSEFIPSTKKEFIYQHTICVHNRDMSHTESDQSHFYGFSRIFIMCTMYTCIQCTCIYVYRLLFSCITSYCMLFQLVASHLYSDTC